MRTTSFSNSSSEKRLCYFSPSEAFIPKDNIEKKETSKSALSNKADEQKATEDRNERAAKRREAEAEERKSEQPDKQLDASIMRMESLQKIAAKIGIPKEHSELLTFGKVKEAIRAPVEQIGVYVGGKHIGDIYAGIENGNFSKEEGISDDFGNFTEKGLDKAVMQLEGQIADALEARGVKLPPVSRESTHELGYKIVMKTRGVSLDRSGKISVAGKPVVMDNGRRRGQVAVNANTESVAVARDGNYIIIELQDKGSNEKQMFHVDTNSSEQDLLVRMGAPEKKAE